MRTVKGYVFKRTRNYWEEDERYCIFSTKLDEEDDFIFVCEVDVSFEEPQGFNPVAQEVSALEKKLDRMADDYHKQVLLVKGRINDLKCIEHTSAI